MMISICPTLVSHSTELYFGHHLLDGDLLADLCGRFESRVAIIADQGLKELYVEELARRLGADCFYIPSGEEAKTRETKERIEDHLLRGGHGRDTVILAIGGGATTDVVGFVASTYMRGIPLILIPTTLLAMVDGAIGGKTAINTQEGKNLLGSLYHPKAVVADFETLKTLPEDERLNGLSEGVKMGLVFDPSILSLAEGSDEWIVKAAEGKIAIIQQDPSERGLRRILNFGHTIGHGLEGLSNYTLSHGQAVAIGSLAESYLSCRLGYLPQKDFEEIQALFQRFWSDLKLPVSYDRKGLLEGLSMDKKKAGSDVRFVLIDQIGQAVSFGGEYCRSVPQNDLDATLDWMEEKHG